VGDDGIGRAGLLGNRRRKLPPDDGQREPCAPLACGLADAHDGGEPGPVGGARLRFHVAVALGVVGAPLRVADDHSRGAGVLQHLRRDVASVGAARRRMAILPAHLQARADRLPRERRDQRRRRADHRLHAGGETRLCQPIAHAPRLGERRGKAVHLPVARDQRPDIGARSCHDPCILPRGAGPREPANPLSMLNKHGEGPPFDLPRRASVHNMPRARSKAGQSPSPSSPARRHRQGFARARPAATRKRPPMLDAMRRGALNWVAKVLLGLLIIAFAIWGVADVFRGYGRGTLARIGNTDITVDEYRQAYQDEMTSISRRLGRRLTAEQAKLLGVEQRTLSRLIGVAAIDMHAHELKLALSDKAVADLIRQDPAFQDVTGKFSNDAFRAILRQNGYTEARYLASRRRDEVREQLTDTLATGVAPPQLLVDLLYRYREETRIIDYFVPDYAKLVKTPEPDEAKLKDYYEQNKRQFVTPELRKVDVLLITRADVKARLPVSEDEVKAAYEQDKEKYDIPEKRRIQQLAFPDKAAAEKAYAELAKAANFAEAAAKLGFKESDYDLGVLTRKDLIDSKVADAAFALKKDELSKPVEGQFSVVLLRVPEI